MRTPTLLLAASLAIAVPACGGASHPSDPATDPTPPGATTTYTARVTGRLADPDLAGARGYHDAFAQHGEPIAGKAGDFAHQVLLGTTDAGTTENEFVAIDQWRNLDGARGVYGDPQFAAGLGKMFAAPPTVELFARRTDWHGWGDMGSGRATGKPYWFVLVHGRLAKSTLAENQAAHDAVAGGNEQLATAAGDIAHLPHLAVDDEREFFNVDIWSDETAMLQVFGNPQFQAAFQGLFESPPDVRVYRSTDWYQWYQP